VSASVTETVNATKVRIDAEEALKLLDGIDTFVAMKGAKVVTFDLKKDRPSDEVLLSHLMGPTGNLRAPTARVGKMLLVGFNEGAYQQHLGEPGT
jgi:arsenate reductase-like glutaredoxin family protein